MLLHSHKLKFIKNNKKYNYKAEKDFSQFLKKNLIYILDKFLKKSFFKFFSKIGLF